MGKNIRRVTKQKWYDDKTIKRRVINNKVEYYVENDSDIQILDEKDLIKSYFKKNKNNKLSKSWNFNFQSFKNSKQNFIYKNLKKHEKECLNDNKLFCGFKIKGEKKEGEFDVKGYSFNKKNLPKEKELIFSGGKVECYVKGIDNAKDIFKQNKFLENLNKLLFDLVNNYINNKKENNKNIQEFHQKLLKYINEKDVKAIYTKEEFIEILNSKLKKKKGDGKSKIKQENKFLHSYYYEMIFSDNEKDELYKKYEREFYKTIAWFKNQKFELNKTLNLTDGKYCSKYPNKVNMKKRLYGDENKFDIKKMYQNDDDNVRMEKLQDMKREQLKGLIEDVVGVFSLEELQQKIVDKTYINDELSVKKIIAIQKSHYKEKIVPYVDEQKFLENNNEEKRQLMKTFNIYLKGRYTKVCNEFKKGNLDKNYLRDIYNPQKVKDKFILSVENKLNLFYLSNQRLDDIRESTDLEYQKMLQTYFMKLIDKIDYCSKIPINDEYRIADILYGDKYNRNNNKFDVNPTYFLSYFPVNEKKSKNKMDKYKNSLERLQIFRNNIFHLDVNLNYLIDNGIEESLEDIEFLNENIENLMLQKYSSNNIHKFFDQDKINEIYMKMLGKKELNIFNYNIYLPTFSKVFNKMYNEKGENLLLSPLKELIGNDNEKKGALKYFLQTLYYYGYSNEDIIIDNLKLEEYTIAQQRISSIKGDSKKENKEKIEKIAESFEKYLKEKIEVNFDDISNFNEEFKEEISKDLFKDIAFTNIEYIEENILFNLCYYLDSKKLSSLIHDTKKLVQALSSINRLKEEEYRKIKLNIDMMVLLLQYKDKIKNINYNNIIEECQVSLNNNVIQGELRSFFNTEDKFDHNKIKDIKNSFESKVSLYEKNIKLLQEGYKDFYIGVDGKEQGIYKENGIIIIHSGIEYYQKYNLSKMLENIVYNDNSIKLQDSDIEEYEKLEKEISVIEEQENTFISEFNDCISNIQSKNYKLILSEKFQQREEYAYIVENNKEKNKYHYLNNKIKFNHLRYINSFIDEILVRLNVFMLYWERDANIVVDKYISDKGFENILMEGKEEDFKKKKSVDRKQYFKNNNGEEINLLLEKYTNYKTIYKGKEINALDIRNFLSHNNYYEIKKEQTSYTLLELINIVHEIMSYNLKYQKAVLDVFNKILLKYKVGNENNKKNNLPLKYIDGYININKDFFKPRKHIYFQELELNSVEYVNHIQKVLEFKNEI